MEERPRDGSQVFHASWRSGLVGTALLTVLFAAGLGRHRNIPLGPLRKAGR